MKIAQINSAGGWGGGESLVFQLSCGLRERGHEICGVVRPDGPLEKKLGENGFSCSRAPRGAADLGGVLRLAILARRQKIAFFHAHAGRDFAPTLLAGALSKTPVILHRHVPLPLKKATRRLAAKFAAAICVPSTFVRDALPPGADLPPEKIHVLPFGVDARTLRALAPKQARAAREEFRLTAPLILSVGHLHESKGHEDLIRATAILREKNIAAQLFIAGEGPDKARLEALISQLDLRQNAVLLGARNDVPGLLELCDVFALLSYEEAQGLAFVEAMALEKPIVAANAGGVPDMVWHEKNGLLCAPHAPKSAAEALERLLGDSELKKQLGEAGRERADGDLSFAATIARFEALYRAILGEKA